MKYFSAKVFSAFSALVASSLSAHAAFNQVYDGGLSDRNIYRFSATGVRSLFVSGIFADSIVFDTKGNLFVADKEANTIAKVTPAGAITTFATGVSINGLAFDSFGNLFATDNTTNSILKYTPQGVRTTFAAGFNGPIGVAIDRNNNVYVTVTNGGTAGSGSIIKVTPAGAQTAFVASGLYLPQGIAVDNSGNVYEADSGTGRVLKFTVSGNTVTQSPFASSLDGPRSLALDRVGNVYVGEFAGTPVGRITKFTSAGVKSTFASGVTVGGLVLEPPTSELGNISTRASVQTGDRVAIAGFIIRGAQAKHVIVRGLGPTLGRPPFKVPGALQDPTLELHNGTGAVIASNDDWASAANASQIPTNYRPPDSRESAILTTLGSSNYSAILAGKNSTTGIGLAEVYDLDAYSIPVELINVSTRAFVGTNDAVTIGGFISRSGNNVVEVVIRGLGPTLAQPPFNVPGVLADPRLTLADANGNTIATNDNWKDTQESLIQIAGYAPNFDAESAIVAFLPANNYSAILSGNGGTTGIGLVEVYKVLR